MSSHPLEHPSASERYRDRVLKVVARITGESASAETISEHTRLEDLGLDSLSLIIFAEEIEREFVIVIADEDFDMANFQTIGTITRLLDAYASSMHTPRRARNHRNR